MPSSRRLPVRPPLDFAPALLLALLVLLPAVAVPRAAAATARGDDPNVLVDPALLQGLHYRMVGPYRGGRSTAATGVPGQPHTFYFGSTGGGLWRSTDAGESWVNLTDGQIDAGGIGAVAVAPSDPNVIYLGTGSACIRGNVSPGVGAYRSTDGGRTWRFIGLRHAGQIGKILVHPRDPDTAWVAALGNAFGPNPERGVFRTRDGGDTWEKVLYLNERTGVVDLSMHPTNPRILYAGAWGGERKPWTLLSGSTEGGVYRSTDGGDTWDKLEGGLPGGLVGKVGVEVSPANPERVWALIEHAERGGLYRSDDAGEHWRLINQDHSLWERPWYYMHITADPQDENTVWVSNVFLSRSVDGGASFTPVPTAHGDNHDLWINPDDPRIMINADDGGAAVTLNGGRTWSTLRNQPTAEIYRVTVDEQFPYRLYGSQQDNTSVSVPSRLPPSMISDAEDEFQFGGCESGHVAVDPRDPNIIYAGCYGGSITRFDRRTGQAREIVAYPQLQLAQLRSELRYRFQWNAPIRISPHDPNVLYHTAQVVLRSDDGGQSWREISPDLTTNNPEHQDYAGGPITRDGTGVEVYGTIFAFEESPLTPGELWAGSDDGRLHLSRDAGATWREITPPALPSGATINSIDLSRRRAGRAIVAAYRYREADFHPYVYATDDYGASWRSLADGRNGIPDGHFVRVVREDPERAGLLYAGTEFGVYVSFDDGGHWQSLQLNLPVTPVTDIQVHRGDLVLSTQGRSFWILDDVSPLRQLTDAVAEADAWLFAPRPAYRLGGGGFGFSGGRRAEDAPAGAILYYALGEGIEGPVQLEITDADGELVRTFSSDPSAAPPLPEALRVLAAAFGFDLGGARLETGRGLHRFVWDLRYPAPKLPPGAVIFGFLQGAYAVPGTYTATLRVGESERSQSFEVRADPRTDTPPEAFESQFDFLQQVAERLERVADAVTTLRAVRQQVKEAAERGAKALHDEPAVAELEQAAEAIAAALTDIEEQLVQTRSRSFEDPLNYPGKITAQLANLQAVVNSGADAPPTDGAVERLADLDAQMAPLLERLDAVLETDVAAFNARVAELGVPAVVVRKQR